jgi:hypothetical protein
MLILHFLITNCTKQQPPFGPPGFAKLTRENENDEGITHYNLPSNNILGKP